MIEIDGSYLEGGGQIVRTALALSTITGKPFRVASIRKGREKPGLKHQHLYAVRALKELCSAKVIGDELGSQTLEFIPGKINYQNMNIDIGTAGSITLLLQAVFPVAIFSDKKLIIKIRGGTDTIHSMPVDYFTNVFLPHMRGYCNYETELESRGYYPKGGGKYILRIEPLASREKTELTEQGKLIVIKGISHASKDLLHASVAERQAKSARYILNKYDVPVKIDSVYNETLSTGSGITVWALFTKNEETFINPVILGTDTLGERGKKAEKVGEEAALKLCMEIESKAAVDRHLADQLLPFLALFGGSIKTSEITDHCRTNMYTIERFLDKRFIVEGNVITV